MKRILLISFEYPPDRGGIARYLHGIYSHVPPEEEIVLLLDAHLAGSNATVSSHEHVEHKGTVYFRRFFSAWIYPRWIPLLFSAWRIARRHRITEIHCSHVLPIGTLCYLLRFFTGIPYTIYFHGRDIAIARKKKERQWLLRRIIRNAQLCVSNSIFTKQLVEPFFSETSVWSIRYPRVQKPQEISSEAIASFRHKHSLQGSIVLLSVARLVHRKGLDLVLSAVASLRASFPNIVSVIVGAGEQQDQLQQQAKNLQILECVRFIFDASDDDLAQWYRVADCFVLPVRGEDDDVEGYGMVYIEAATYGVPSIATTVGGVPEAVQDGITGMLVPPNNVAALIQTIKILLENNELRYRLGEQARIRALEECVWKE